MAPPIDSDPSDMSRPARSVARPTPGVDRRGLDILDEAACLALLAVGGIGRLGLSVGSLPVIFPVNYAVEGRSIVFRSEPGATTDAAAHRSVACLQIDGFGRFEPSGWSVLATGRLELLPPGRGEHDAHVPVVPWAGSGESRLIELPIELLSGRSILHPDRGV